MPSRTSTLNSSITQRPGGSKGRNRTQLISPSNYQHQNASAELQYAMMHQSGVVVPLGMGAYAPLPGGFTTTTHAKDNGKRIFNFTQTS